jgi:hypothetical protein
MGIYKRVQLYNGCGVDPALQALVLNVAYATGFGKLGNKRMIMRDSADFLTLLS